MMKVIPILFLLISLKVISAQATTDCIQVTEIPLIECKALITLYNDTDGVNWTTHSDWNVTNTPCHWQGIECSKGNVISINLWKKQLSGSIPPELGNLSDLEKLDLSRNQLSGPIPPQLGHFRNLNFLQLSFNQLSGPIPPQLGNLSHLKILGLSSNQLSGPIPPELGNLSNLQQLYFNSNQLR